MNRILVTESDLELRYMAEVVDRLNEALSGRYHIERELGSGGMAIVYLAEDLKHKRKVALKVLRQEIAVAIGSERFVREIEIAANLNHPHILPLFDSGEADGFLYYVMPYVEGESLRERLDRESRIPVDEMVRLTDEIAAALGYAHEQGIVHRDVKPENIMLSGGRAVVADFGIARALTVAGGERLTGTGFAVGTPAYMSPEQAFGDANVDGRSDVYALGCVAYEMVSGRAPFEADTPQGLLAKHAADTVPSMRANDASIPLFVERAVERSLAKDPNDRFQSASEFAEALTSEMVVARIGRQGWHPLAVAAPVLGLVLAAAAWGYFTFFGGTTYERLAVLPPMNRMNDPEQDFLVQGVHSDLIKELQSAGLQVIAQRSVMQYASTQKPIREIAAELDADVLVEASVYRAADSIQLEVQVVDGTTQEYLGDPIVRNGELRNVLTFYRELTAAIALVVQATLGPDAEARLASARPVDPDAYEAYLKGWQSHMSLTAGGLETAEQYYRRALEIDPEHATAWAGIADVWVARQQMGYVPPREAFPLAKAAIAEALALDETNFEAHRSLASILTWGDWNWPEAEREWTRALEINPNDADVLSWYSHFLMHMGRTAEAMRSIERARELDPFNIMIRSFYVVDLVYARRYDEAIVEAHETLRIQPNAPVARSGLYQALVMKEMFDEALAIDRERLSGNPELMEALEQGFEEAGYRGAQRGLAEIFARRSRESGRPRPLTVVARYLYAGDADETIDWLERAFEYGDGQLPYLGQPVFDSIRSDPRFQELLRRMNLPR